ncbi:MAG: indolepyruvate ferredoxin oxidoreductase alpha and beta subunit, partial [Solirubrobacteraceae bacterium]|nr:indolepyruvate ferredoxin oxidoreductase alpha and beta subunit [Solirubrobacteraceae bacterium]
ARPALVDELLAPPVVAAELSAAAREIVGAAGAEGELRRRLEVRVDDLIGYQSAGYARRYAEEVAAVAEQERRLGAPGETAVAEAFARGLHKLMAYKDEYEVARLHLDSVEQAKITGAFGKGAKVRFLLHPPLLRSLGVQRKIKLGRWFVPAFRLLRAGRRLRGTPLDLFGLPRVRRVERALIGEYRELVGTALAGLRPDTHTRVAEIAELADMIRGYEEIKLRNVERFRERAAELTAELR